MLIISNGSFFVLLDKVENVSEKVLHAGFKVNAGKLYIAQGDLELVKTFI